MMLFRWVHCPRLALAPLLLGTLIGFFLGQWFFMDSEIRGYSADDPKVTCLIIVRQKTFRNVNASKLTWVQKCDNYLVVQPNKTKKALSKFASPDDDKCEHPADILAVSADSSWGALCQTFHLLPRPLEWLIIVPDSVLVVVENLKQYVRGRDWRAAGYFGHPVHHYTGEFNVLSAGVVLSNGTVSRLIRRFRDKEACEKSGKYWNNEDLYLGKHLRELGVPVEDTRDVQGRGRFHGFNVNALLSPGSLFRQTDYFKKALFPIKEGLDCCSNDLITVDTSDADHAFLHYFLMYGVGRRGLHPSGLEPTSRATAELELPQWVTALREIGYTGPTDNMTSQQYYEIWAKHIPPEVLSKKLAEVVEP